MGRGRSHLFIQSEWRAPPTRGYKHRGMSTIYIRTSNREMKKIPVPEQALEFMKNMNPQQLADFLLPKDGGDKTSNVSGN